MNILIGIDDTDDDTEAFCLFGALGGLLAGLTLKALRRAGFFTYLAERR